MSSSFLRADGGLASPPARFAGWLPTREQMTQGAQAQFDLPPAAPELEIEPSPWHTSMRQGLGLVVAAALIAGIIPVVLAWIAATRLGTAVPLVQAAQMARPDPAAARWLGPLQDLLDQVQTLAGMEPAVFPGWLAALVSAVGVWINWPLRWLAWWIVYGLGVMVAAKLLGAATTLPRFYALTAYAALPLIVLGLGPIPCLGALATGIALVWAAVVYVAATRVVTGFSLPRTLVCVALPAAVGVLLALLMLLAGAITLLRLSV
jgi:hypothetical protein